MISGGAILGQKVSETWKRLHFSKTGQSTRREPFVALRSNKRPRPGVKLLHNKEHWVTKAKTTMKKTTLAKLLAVACGMVAVSAIAQTSTTVTTKDAAAGTAVSETSPTTATGTFATYTPGSDYFTFESSGTTGTPVKYYYDRNTPVLDPEGRTV